MDKWSVPLSDLGFGPDEEAAVVRVVRSQWLTMGAEVRQFEEAFASYIGVRHAVALSSGTAALHLALAALGVSAGDEVIQPSLNFVAAANMTRLTGATPIFVDIIGNDEPTIDPDELRAAITPRTKAVIVMHYGGYCCRMAEINAICRAARLPVIEDACHASGATYFTADSSSENGVKAGALGTVSCFSFFSNKNLSTGEGGMLLCSSDELAAKTRALRSHCMTTVTLDRHKGHAFDYDVTGIGFNYRPTELVGAIGIEQLKKLEQNNKQRQSLVEHYRLRLEPIEEHVTVPFRAAFGKPAYHIMPVVLGARINRRKVMASLKDRGIQSSIHYRSIHEMSGHRGSCPRPLPRTEVYSQRTLTLPLFPSMTTDMVDRVVSELESTVHVCV